LVIRLTLKSKTGPKGTVIDDKVRGRLSGGDGNDWFLNFTSDESDCR
jgi:hypothetical protein